MRSRRFTERQRQVRLSELAADQARKIAAEARAGRNPAAVVAADRHEVSGDAMKPGQRIRGHSDPAVPRMLKMHRAQRGEPLEQRTAAPIPMNRRAHAPQRPNAAEYEPTGAIQA